MIDAGVCMVIVVGRRTMESDITVKRMDQNEGIGWKVNNEQKIWAQEPNFGECQNFRETTGTGSHQPRQRRFTY